jgi:hypothetical protein
VSPGQLGAVDAGAARQVAKAILSDPRYHSHRGPRPFAGFFRRVGELAVDPVLRLLRAIGDALPRTGSPLWIGLAAVVVAGAVVFAVRLSAGRGRQRFADLGRHGAGHGDLHPDELERRADEAERRGDLDTALRLRFRAGLIRLADAGAVRLRPGLTNAAVGRTLRSARFDELAGDFDEVAYGGRPASEADLTVARSGWPAVVDEARSGVGPRR